MIFVFEVALQPGYTAEQYAQAWTDASRIMQQAPGARGTRLHRKIGDDSTLLAIASWETKACRDEMETALPQRAREIIEQQAAFVTVKVLGEYEDPEWIVSPASSNSA